MRSGLLLLLTAGLATAAPVERLTPPGPVPRYGLCELRLAPEVVAPYDAFCGRGVTFRAPSGRTVAVPAFRYQPCEATRPTTPPQGRVDLLKFFVTELESAAGTQVEYFLDDLTFLTTDGREVLLDDFETGDLARWGGPPQVTASTAVVHGGQRALRFAPTLAGERDWPGATLRPPEGDWTRYRGLAFWMLVRAPRHVPELQGYFHDTAYGNSQIVPWRFGPGALALGQWHRLEWRFASSPAPVTPVALGQPEWRVRFTPTEVGAWSWQAGGEPPAARGTFEVTASPSHGFVRVSRADPRYFEFDDGTPFFGIGHDVPWRLPDVLAHYPKLAAQGANATYFILCPWDLSIEWEKLGAYDLGRAWQLDQIVEAAQRHGIYVKLSFDIHDAFRPSKRWAENPYNTARGGPCATVNAFYTSPAAWEVYARRLRYLAARWGYSPHLMAWEPFAENDGATQREDAEGWAYPSKPGGAAVSAMLTAWLPKVAAELQRWDPNDRLFTCSFGGDVSDDAVWALPAIDYLQIHSYNHLDVAPVLARWASDLPRRFAKPLMVTEFGWDVQALDLQIDPEGLCLHNGIWSTTAAGAASAALNWWWERIDALGLQRHYRPLRSFVDGVDFPRESFHAADLRLTVPDQGRPGDVTVSCEGPLGGGPAKLTVARDGSVTAPPPQFLLAAGRTEPRVRPEIHVDYPAAGRFEVEVGSVSPDARLDIYLDGALVRRVDLPASNVPGKPCVFVPQYQVWRCDWDEAFAIDVPAGPHVIRLENSHPGGSWIRVARCRLVGYRPVTLRAWGQTGRTTSLVWVQHSASTWGDWRRGRPAPIVGARLALGGLAAGRYRAEWFDTWTGQVSTSVVQVAGDGRLELPLAPVERDVALRLRKDPPAR